MGAWGTAAFENDTPLDLLGDVADGRFSLESLLHDVEAAYLDHESGVAVLTLVELWLVGHGLREMPVTKGITADLIRRTISDEQAQWLLDQVPRVLAPGSEEYALWREAGPKTFAEWVGHANAAAADLRRAFGPGTDQTIG